MENKYLSTKEFRDYVVEANRLLVRDYVKNGAELHKQNARVISMLLSFVKNRSIRVAEHGDLTCGDFYKSVRIAIQLALWNGATKDYKNFVHWINYECAENGSPLRVVSQTDQINVRDFV